MDTKTVTTEVMINPAGNINARTWEDVTELINQLFADYTSKHNNPEGFADLHGDVMRIIGLFSTGQTIMDFSENAELRDKGLDGEVIIRYFLMSNYNSDHVIIVKDAKTDMGYAIPISSIVKACLDA